MLHQMKLQSVPFVKIKEGSKTLELRLNDEKRQLIKVGDEIEFSLAEDTTQKILTRVEGLHHFPTFKDLCYSFEPKEYGSADKEEYMDMYKYYSKEDETKYGVLGIRIKTKGEESSTKSTRMSKYKKEALSDIRERLKMSDRKKWKSLTEDQRTFAVNRYYEIRDEDYKDLRFFLREHTGERKQFAFLMLAILIGIFAAPISSIILKYFPSESVWDDLKTVIFFGLLLYLMAKMFFRVSAEFMGDENILERLLEEEKDTQK